MAYLDTNALVKRCHKHPDIERFTVTISELSIVEFASALRRKADEKVIRQKEMSYVLIKFQEDLADFIILKFDSNVISNAVEFVMKYRLKTLDSLQLSFATKLKEYDPLFVSFDRKLLNSAKLEGFRVLDIKVTTGGFLSSHER